MLSLSDRQHQTVPVEKEIVKKKNDLCCLARLLTIVNKASLESLLTSGDANEADEAESLRGREGLRFILIGARQQVIG